jgi:hypothetical protein
MADGHGGLSVTDQSTRDSLVAAGPPGLGVESGRADAGRWFVFILQRSPWAGLAWVSCIGSAVAEHRIDAHGHAGDRWNRSRADDVPRSACPAGAESSPPIEGTARGDAASASTPVCWLTLIKKGETAGKPGEASPSRARRGRSPRCSPGRAGAVATTPGQAGDTARWRKLHSALSGRVSWGRSAKVKRVPQVL